MRQTDIDAVCTSHPTTGGILPSYRDIGREHTVQFIADGCYAFVFAFRGDADQASAQGHSSRPETD